MKARMTWIPLTALLALAACGGPQLDTRTFQLRHMGGGEAENIIRPYVFRDRPKAPGEVSSSNDAITVRETPDNLDKIARVLAEYDRPPLTVRLHFRIIEADGAVSADPSIADVEAVLRGLFRFRGYRLLGDAVLAGLAYSEASQQIAGSGGPYRIRVQILDVRGSADSGTVRLTVILNVPIDGSGGPPIADALTTTVSLRAGQTAVVGNAKLNVGQRTIILAVKPELVQN